MIKPTRTEAKTIAATGDYRLLPLSTEIYADIITPISLLKILRTKSKHCFILESAEDAKTWGRYSFLGYDPQMAICCLDSVMQISSADGENSFETDDPNAQIKAILSANKSPKLPGLPPFCGGLVGYFAYDWAKYTEPALKFSTPCPERFPDADLMLFDKVIAFDHYRQKIIIIVNISTDDLDSEYERGVLALKELVDLIENGTSKAEEAVQKTTTFNALFTKDEYCRMVDKAKHYIREGDIFQVVLSNRLEATFEGSLLDTYRALRTINPSPYMFYLGGTDLEIAGASPETLVKLQDGRLFTYPLAGTRPRGATDAEDLALEQELLADEKEVAEHNMLVDLGRNDLGKICMIGSVTVDKYMQMLRFSHVMHIGSTVCGDILPDLDGLDAINAVLPAGTLSGAPKIRAMQIISELEQNKRGIYGGAIGYLDFAGNMDCCIAIRIAYKRGGKVFIRAGAGIVADSVPEKEYQECENKAKAVRAALEDT